MLQLYPLSARETPKVTHLERDVRAITAVRDLATFRRFLALVASRHGQVLNKTNLAAPLGVSVPTVTQWLGILETTAQILVVSPFAGSLFEGFIASEIVKAQVNDGRRRELYHFRDEQGLEVDFVVPGRSGAVALVECKATRTVTPAMAAPSGSDRPADLSIVGLATGRG